MNDTDFQFFETLLKQESGLSITREKMYLLESRLLPLSSRYEVTGGLEGIAAAVRMGTKPDLRRAVIEAMTTNETSFFRDNTPFNALRDNVLPYMLQTRAMTRTLRIWSAACSSGQEPYSIAMLLKEMGAKTQGWRIEIVATDLSYDILAQAESALYSQFEVQRGLPIQLLMKYFTQEGDRWRIKPEIREMVKFKPLNLLSDYGGMGQFDIIFCRNVLIYFDQPTKDKVLQSVKQVLKQDGILFLGGAETVMGITKAFKPFPAIRGAQVREDTTFSPEKAVTGT